VGGRQGRKKRRAGAPLTPAATALAMLPGGEASQGHAPEALKHLLQEGSPLYPLYEVCGTCEALVDTLAAANNVSLFGLFALCLLEPLTLAPIQVAYRAAR